MTFSFLQNSDAELRKCKNTAALWLTLIGAAFIPAVNVIKCLNRPDYFASQLEANPWKTWAEYNWQIAAVFLLTIYIILVTSLVVQIEYRNGGWKQVYTSPRSYADIFFSKFLAIHVLVVGCFIFFNFSMISSGYLTALLNDRYTFQHHSLPWKEMTVISFKMYVSILGMIIIQYWLSLRFRNFIVPLGVGLAFFTCGFMIRQWEHIDYYPYMYPFLVYFKNPGISADTANHAMVNSVIVFILCTGLAFADIASRNEKG